LLDSADFAADTSNTDIAAAAFLHFSFARQAVTHGCLGGKLMNRTLLVLALAVSTSAGCRAIGPQANCGCVSCQVARSQHAPRPVGCCDTCGDVTPDGTCANCLQNSALCQGGGNCEFFSRNCGCNCGGAGCGECGLPPGPYDCSACESPAWGCNGYGYNRAACRGLCHGAGLIGGNGYCGCCGAPAPSCCCSSGDHIYNFMPGPPAAQTAYPYYTVRGPRDFLLANPPRLGPF
jgi:hypothetical protein